MMRRAGKLQRKSVSGRINSGSEKGLSCRSQLRIELELLYRDTKRSAYDHLGKVTLGSIGSSVTVDLKIEPDHFRMLLERCAARLGSVEAYFQLVDQMVHRIQKKAITVFEISTVEQITAYMLARRIIGDNDKRLIVSTQLRTDIENELDVIRRSRGEKPLYRLGGSTLISATFHAMFGGRSVLPIEGDFSPIVSEIIKQSPAPKLWERVTILRDHKIQSLGKMETEGTGPIHLDLLVEGSPLPISWQTLPEAPNFGASRYFDYLFTGAVTRPGLEGLNDDQRNHLLNETNVLMLVGLHKAKNNDLVKQVFQDVDLALRCGRLIQYTYCSFPENGAEQLTESLRQVQMPHRSGQIFVSLNTNEVDFLLNRMTASVEALENGNPQLKALRELAVSVLRGLKEGEERRKYPATERGEWVSLAADYLSRLLGQPVRVRSMFLDSLSVPNQFTERYFESESLAMNELLQAQALSRQVGSMWFCRNELLPTDPNDFKPYLPRFTQTSVSQLPMARRSLIARGFGLSSNFVLRREDGSGFQTLLVPPPVANTTQGSVSGGDIMDVTFLSCLGSMIGEKLMTECRLPMAIAV